jgi:hypothetical protein
MPEKADLTPEQKRKVAAMIAQAFAVRGVQVSIVALGVCLAVLDRRGWPAVLISVWLAAYGQLFLPVRPPWLEKLRQGHGDD